MHVCFYIDHVCIHLWAVPGESFSYVFLLFLQNLTLLKIHLRSQEYMCTFLVDLF